MSRNLSFYGSKSTIEEAINNQNDVALFLSKLLFSTKAKHSNSVFSPASVTAALTLVASGPDDPSISKEILSFLNSSSVDDLNAVFSEIASVVLADRSANGGPKISSVNGVWIEQSLRIDSSFKDLFVNFFKASFDRVDFRSKAEEVRVELNTWASNHTNGLIRDLLPPGSITKSTDLVYGNALYFKGEWEVPFDKSHTRNEKFHLVNGGSVSVPFMSSVKKLYVEAYDGFKVLKLPYRQGSCGDEEDTNGGF
ncbi:unnamed protein product [Microthlaspi erraticum]|uniref:Serpin domain-containing protein n=1 Tax=Microthlaspi erraticum TaxID=1685480 RepID=A0A6D2KJX4_9BRAS|nr:unnamed protein product [Microthlaspi erraticum]